MPSILSISSVNNGLYKTQIQSKKDSLNDEDLKKIQEILSSNSIKQDSNRIYSSESIENVVQSLENSGFYFVEIKDQEKNIYQLTPTNWSQGKQPQLRQ